MRNTIICALLLWSAAAFAQNLNPTVEVTNIYAREASGIEKPSQLLEIPDSLTRFNLDFDYAVNETPYQGAYEFTPYLVEPRPSGRASTERKLYLRVGAGYPLHPEFAAVWTPVKTQKFRLNIFGDHSSYIGQYHNIALDNAGIFAPDGTYRQGVDMRSAVGADFMLNWRRGIWRTDVQYNHFQATDLSLGDFTHHVARASTRVQNVPGTTKVDYEVGTAASFIWAPSVLQEIHTLTDASMRIRAIRMGVQVETVTQPTGTLASFTVTPPKYIYSNDRFSFAGGIKVGFVLRSDPAFAPSTNVPFFPVFPDIQVAWTPVKEHLTLYLNVTGGNEVMSYDTYLSKDPFIAGANWYTDVKPQRVLAMLGLRGNIGHRFYYNVSGGYTWIENMWLWAFDPTTLLPGVSYAGPVHSFIAQANVGWKNRSLDIQANFRYVNTFSKVTYKTDGLVPFAPQVFSGNAKAFYNWGSRIRAGFTLEGRSQLKSRQGTVPGFLDLGFQASYQFSRAVGIWLKLGNLLNQPVQRVPFYAENGLYFTAGFTFNL